MNSQLLEQLKAITAEEQEILRGSTHIDKTIYMDQPTDVIDSAKMMEKGKLIHVRTHTRFVHFPKHRHNYVEMIYMCQGSTTHLINGEKVVLEQGDLLLLSQNAVQEILPAGEEDIAVNFFILPEFFEGPLGMIGEEESQLRDFVVSCLQPSEGNTGYLHFRVADVLPIQNLLENLIWTIWNNQPNKRSTNQITMGLLFLQLLNYTERLSVGANDYEQELMLTVLRFIEERYRDGELQELAESLNYEPYWLSRMIHSRTGKTYTELVQERRLRQAVYLLRHTKTPVSEVGLAAGYENLSYFHRIFRERYGMTPKKFRDGKEL